MQITKKTNIDESFKAYKRDHLKAIYKIKFDNENTYHERRTITKFLKLDKNNQHGYAMTKPMPTGCIKEHPSLTAQVQPPSRKSRFKWPDWTSLCCQYQT